jgi:hypothetical protein
MLVAEFEKRVGQSLGAFGVCVSAGQGADGMPFVGADATRACTGPGPDPSGGGA